MMIVNPGTSPMRDTSPKLAKAGIAQFVKDLHMEDLKIKRDKKGDNDGWYGFMLKSEHAKVSVLMPGLPMSAMRWMPGDKESAWVFQRLYVDGGSWLWKFALEIAGEGLSGRRS